MSLEKDISNLLAAGVINAETAANIEAYYRHAGKNSNKRLFAVFGALGAILVGLGIILMIAHNWDDLSRSIKTVFAFLPLLIGQLACVYSLLKRKDQQTWRESSSAFLFLAVGASIALVSQIYHLEGNTADFLFTWMLLGLPLLYLMNSAVTSLLYIAGVSYYGTELGYWTYPSGEPYFYWLMLLAAMPFYYRLIKHRPQSAALNLHHWFVPLSLTICLGTLAKESKEWMYVAYMSLFGICSMLAQLPAVGKQSASYLSRNNGYGVIGTLGSLSLLLTLSFDYLWNRISRHNYLTSAKFQSPEFYGAMFISLLALLLLYRRYRQGGLPQLRPFELVFLVFLPLYFLGFVTVFSVVLINILVLALGVLILREGAKQDHLGILNFGLLILAALALCRFFDDDLSFILRGSLFMGVGIGFFVANYRILKKRKTHEA